MLWGGIATRQRRQQSTACLVPIRSQQKKGHQGKHLWNVGVKGILNLKRVAGKASPRRWTSSGGASQEWCLGNFLGGPVTLRFHCCKAWLQPVRELRSCKPHGLKKTWAKEKKGGRTTKKQSDVWWGQDERKTRPWGWSSPLPLRNGWEASGPKGGPWGRAVKAGGESEEGAQAGCTGPGCPSEDVNFYKVECELLCDDCGLRVAGRGREISWELVVTVQMKDVWRLGSVMAEGVEKGIRYRCGRQSLRICCRTRHG